MRVAAPREIKDNEFRVGLTPASAQELVRAGNEVIVEKDAGVGAGFADADYLAAGAQLAERADEIFATADLIIKVKEPQAIEIEKLRHGQVLFTYLHLAADSRLTRALMASGATCIAYETVSAPDGGLPLLAPMSEIAGRLAPQMGARFLEKHSGGRGVLLAGAPGVPPAEAFILGAGNVGLQAAMIAMGMGAHVTMADRNIDALRRIDARFGAQVSGLYATHDAIAATLRTADLVICAALTRGAKAPLLITRDMLKTMKPRAVIVDVAIDQGGCCETSRPTSHSDPVYIVDDIIHYCVTNMPGVVPRTSTLALNNATLPFALAIAAKGWRKALRDDPFLKPGLEICDGRVVSMPVAEAHGLPFTNVEDLLAT